jgi:hypothetical protein
MPAMNIIDICPALVSHVIRLGTVADLPDVRRVRKTLLPFVLMKDSNVLNSLFFLIFIF